MFEAGSRLMGIPLRHLRGFRLAHKLTQRLLKVLPYVMYLVTCFMYRPSYIRAECHVSRTCMPSDCRLWGAR